MAFFFYMRNRHLKKILYSRLNRFRVKSTLLSLANHHLAKIAQLVFPAFLFVAIVFISKTSCQKFLKLQLVIFLSQPYDRRRDTTLSLKTNLIICFDVSIVLVTNCIIT